MSREALTIDRRGLAPAIVVFVLAVGFLIWAQSYDGRGRLVPVLVGWLTSGLAALDLIVHSGTRFGRYVDQLLSGAMRSAVDDAAASKSMFRREAIAVLWLFGFVALVAVFGFVAVIPFYILIFMVVQGRRSLRESVIAALCTTLFVFVVFEIFLRYNVYGGLLFHG